MFDSIHEECGVFGIFENKKRNVAHDLYIALLMKSEKNMS